MSLGGGAQLRGTSTELRSIDGCILAANRSIHRQGSISPVAIERRGTRAVRSDVEVGDVKRQLFWIGGNIAHAIIGLNHLVHHVADVLCDEER